MAERLRAADDLIAENEPLDALEMLTELNRKHPDPDIEERLVLLRRDAFSALEQSEGRASWPPEFEDPFEGIDGLIEIKAPDLSLEVLGGAVRHHGHLLVRGLLPQAMVDRLVDAIDRAFAARDAHKQGAPASETAPWFVPIPSHPRYPTAPGGIEHTACRTGCWSLIPRERFSRSPKCSEKSGSTGSWATIWVIDPSWRRTNGPFGGWTRSRAHYSLAPGNLRL